MPTRAAPPTLSYIIYMISIMYIVSIIWCMQQSTWWWKEVHLPHAHPFPLYLGRLHSTHPVPVWAKRAVCHKVSSAQPAERHKWPKSRLSHIPHPCYLSNPWILNMFLLSGKPFTPKIDINYEELKVEKILQHAIVMCGINCCVMLNIVKGYRILSCVWYWSIFSHNFHLWNRIRLITLNQ